VPLSTKLKTTKLHGSPTVYGWTRNCPTGALKLQFQRYALDLTSSNKDFEETGWTRVDGLTNHNRGNLDWTSIWNARWRSSYWFISGEAILRLKPT
jgi:hypothetical protein